MTITEKENIIKPLHIKTIEPFIYYASSLSTELSSHEHQLVEFNGASMNLILGAMYKINFLLCCQKYIFCLYVTIEKLFFFQIKGFLLKKKYIFSFLQKENYKYYPKASKCHQTQAETCLQNVWINTEFHDFIVAIEKTLLSI